jgi:hypothetical protein
VKYLVTKEKYMQKEDRIEFRIIFLFSIVASAIYFYSILFKYSSTLDWLICLMISSFLISLDLILLMTYPYYRKNIFEGNFPTYGKFLSRFYWKKINKDFLYGLFFGLFVTLTLSLIMSYGASISIKNIQNYNIDLIFFVIPFSITLNLIVFYSYFKNRFFVDDEIELFLKYLLDTKFITKTEFEDLIINYKKDKQNFDIESLKDEMFKKAIKNKTLLMHPFVGTLYYEINWLFVNLSPEIEAFTDETYRLLKLLITSEKYQQNTFLQDFNNLKENLLTSEDLNPNNWTMIEVLKIYINQHGIKIS